MSISTTSLNHLPRETTVDILSRLSVKDLIRSTSVNKTWYSLINNPCFISSQIRYAISSSDDNSVLIIPPFTSYQNYCSLINAATSDLIQKFDIPFQTKSGSLKLVAQVHGLLLLTDLDINYASRELILWNPFVKRHRVLVSSCFRNFLDNRDRTYCVSGMGYDKANDDYKVVRIVYVGDRKQELCGDVQPRVEVYSFRKQTWRRLRDAGLRRLVNGYGVHVNGCFYWVQMVEPVMEDFSTLRSDELRIMCFDFESEMFGELKMPDGVPECLGMVTPFKLMEFEGLLAFCVLDTKSKYVSLLYVVDEARKRCSLLDPAF